MRSIFRRYQCLQKPAPKYLVVGQDDFNLTEGNVPAVTSSSLQEKTNAEETSTATIVKVLLKFFIKIVLINEQKNYCNCYVP